MPATQRYLGCWAVEASFFCELTVFFLFDEQAGKQILAGFSSFGGGESSTYIDMAEKARERAFLRLLEHAAATGGNGS